MSSSKDYCNNIELDLKLTQFVETGAIKLSSLKLFNLD